MNWAKGIDPKTGALIEPRRPEPGKRELLCPNLLGARSWNHGRHNPGTGLWVLPCHGGPVRRSGFGPR